MSWSTVKLCEVCKTTQGVQIPKKDTQNRPYDGSCRYLYIADFIRDDTQSFVDDRYDSKKVSEDDLVMANTGSPGRVFKGKNGILSNNLFRISFDPNVLDRNYFYSYLASSLFQNHLGKQMKGGIQKHLGHKTIARQIIPLPPLPEQKRIATILDAADALRSKRRQSIAELDTLLQATFLDMFGDPVTNPKGWDLSTLPDVAIRLTDGPFGSNLKSSHYVADGIRVLRLQNIGIGKMLDEDLAYISEDHFNNLPRNHCEPGDVIIATLGDPNLRACVIPRDLKKSLNKADCLLMRVNPNKVAANYISWLLNCPAIISFSLSLVRGQTRGRISLGRIKTMKIPVPPLELQREFATIVESIEAQKARMQSHLQELDTLFAALQQRAFNGEL